MISPTQTTAELHDHTWSLGLLGTGTEECPCGARRPRGKAPTEEEERRLLAAEQGFRNGSAAVARELDGMAAVFEDNAAKQDREARAWRRAAEHARLIGKGRSGG